MRICLPGCRLEIDSGPWLLLGPFRHAHSLEDAHRQAVAGLIQAPTALVAAVDDQIVGVVRGIPGRLHSLLVHASYHGLGHQGE